MSLLSRHIAQSLPLPIAELPQPIYLVGGSVRDLLLQRIPVGKRDLDLVTTEDPVVWGGRLARHLKSGFVVLDAERRIVRLVFADLTLDIALQVGPTIEDDLQQRDYACNAIAIELHSFTWVDPHQGREDIEERRIRMICPDNLSQDPLRLLRAYRQAAQLNFHLDPATESAIIARAPQLQKVAAERVRAELDAMLLQGSRGLDHLQQAAAHGLLQSRIPAPLNIAAAQQIHILKDTLAAHYPHAWQTLQNKLADQRPTLLIVLWAALLSKHPPNTAGNVLADLRYSRAEQQGFDKITTLLPEFQKFVDPCPLDRYRLFQNVGSLFPALALLALATGSPWDPMTLWLDHSENPQDPLAHPVMLIDGTTLMRALRMKPSPRIGHLLTLIGEAQAQGWIHSAAEALDFARQILLNSEDRDDRY